MQSLAMDLFNTDDFAQLAQYVPASTSTTSLNRQTSAATYVLLDNSEVSRCAQIWTQDQASTVNQVVLRLQRVGTLTANSYMLIQLVKITSGDPDMTQVVARSAAVDCSDVSTSAAWVTFTLNAECNVDASTQYAVVLTGSFTASGSNGIRWFGNTASPSGGVYYQPTDDTGSQFSNSAADWYTVADFMVYAAVPVIFDAPYQQTVMNDVVVENTQPSVTCRTADVQDATNSATLVLSSTTYHVTAVKPDGTGLTVLELSVDNHGT